MNQFKGLLSSGRIPYFVDELAGQIFLSLVPKEGRVTHKQLDEMVASAISMAERMDSALVARWAEIKAAQEDR